MRKRLVALTAALLLIGVMRAAAGPGDEAVVRGELEEQYRKLVAAHEARDLKAILALKTPDFHALGPDGRLLDASTTAEYSRRFLEENKGPLRIRFTVRS